MNTAGMGSVGQIELTLKPTEVPEWDEEDLIGADLAEEVEKADADTAAQMISACSFRLPADIAKCELVAYAAEKDTPLGSAVLADSSNYDFHLIVVPVNIVIPAPQRLVRLRLILDLRAETPGESVVAWDMFPNDNIQNVDVKVGEVNVDISKALGFVFPAPVTDVLGLKLQFPLGWKSVNVVVDSSGSMSNPAEWYVNDAAITSSFIGYAILRAPKGEHVTIAAELAGDIRRPGLVGWLFKTYFPSVAANLCARLRSPMNETPSQPAGAGAGRDHPQYVALMTVLSLGQAMGFSQIRLEPHADEMADILGQACPSDEEIGSILPRAAAIARRFRLPGLFLAFWMQRLTLRRKSPYHVLTCRLYSDAQTNLAGGLAVHSLENAFAALIGWHRAQRDEELVQVAATAVEMQMPDTRVLSAEDMAVASERFEQARSKPYEYLYRDLLTLMREYHKFYAHWTKPFGYMDNNPLTENLFWYRTGRELANTYPAETRPGSQPGGLQLLIEQLGSPEHAPGRLAARRMLAATRQPQGDIETAIEQYRRGVEEATAEGIDTELGHMRRGLGFALFEAKQFDEAAEQAEQALRFESSSQAFSYWAALSASELGNARVAPLWGKHRKYPFPDAVQARLRSVMEAYSEARELLEHALASEPIPVDRALTQQLFRSYHSGAVQVALEAADPDHLLLQMESNAPRQAIDLTAEIRAASKLPIGEQGFRQAATVFHRHLTAVPDDFDDYARSVIEDVEARNLYLRARASADLTEAARLSQSSKRTLDQLQEAELPGVVILALDVGWEQTVFAYLVPEQRSVVLAGQTAFGERDLLRLRERYVAALTTAEQLVAPARGRAIQDAIDTLTAALEKKFGVMLEAGLPWYHGRHLKILPRLAMMTFPIHAMKVSTGRLIEQCDVSYAPSLATLLAAHNGPAPTETTSVLMVHDDQTTPLFAGTAAALTAAYGNNLEVLRRPAWETFLQNARERQGELFFACHGSHNPNAPAASCLWFDRRTAPPVTFAELLSDFDASHFGSVVLGACESGLVRAEVAAEYTGLPVVFLANGARHVVSSLWRAHQVATAILLSHYFTQRKTGATVPAALCAAQRTTAAMTSTDVATWLKNETPEQAGTLTRALKRLDPIPFAHPYYWAAFQTNGDI